MSPCNPTEHLNFSSSVLPLLSYVFISVTVSHLCSLSSSNGFFPLELFVTSFFFSNPTFFAFFHFLSPLFLFHSFAFIPGFCPLILWLLKDVEWRHVSGHRRTFRSQQERDWHGLAGSCAHTHTHKHAEIHSHTPVLSYQIPHKELHSRKARCHREKKQRDGMFFSPNTPLSFSFSPALAIVVGTPLQCSTNMRSDQRVCGVRSRGQDGRVWKTRWEGAAGEQRCQSNILVSGACIPVACQQTSELTWRTISVLSLLLLCCHCWP